MLDPEAAGRYQLMKLKEVMQRTSLGSTTIYRKMDLGEFPKARRLGANSVRWLESEIVAWIRGIAGDPTPSVVAARKTERASSPEKLAMQQNSVPRTNFRQADIERLIRAARKAGAVIHFDVRTLVATIVPLEDNARRDSCQADLSTFAPDGRENWDE